MSTDRDLDHARMRYALTGVLSWPGPRHEELVRECKGLPVSMRGQGLAVTCATLMNRQRPLADLIARWLLEDAPRRTLVEAAPRGTVSDRLLRALRDSERNAYVAAQNEALALCEHLKRFAEVAPEPE